LRSFTRLTNQRRWSHGPRPAIAANIAKRLWEIGDIVNVEQQDIMIEILGAFVLMGVFVIWCDVTDGWSSMHRRIGALLPPYSKSPHAKSLAPIANRSTKDEPTAWR
jgi:hypothetical protein